MHYKQSKSEAFSFSFPVFSSKMQPKHWGRRGGKGALEHFQATQKELLFLSRTSTQNLRLKPANRSCQIGNYKVALAIA